MRRLLVLVATVCLASIASSAVLAANPSTNVRNACKQRTLEFAGSVVSVGSSSLIVEVERTGGDHVEGLGGKRVNVNVDQSTQIVRDGNRIGLSDLVFGEHVGVVAEGCRGDDPARKGLTAKLIRAGDRELSLAGSVVSVGAGSLTVEVDKVAAVTSTLSTPATLVGKQITLAITQTTKIYRDGKPAQLSDLQAGDRVRVRVHAVGNEYTALTILARAPTPTAAGTAPPTTSKH